MAGYHQTLASDRPDWHEALCDGATLLTVNQRLARHYREQYERRQHSEAVSWWETPDILPWQVFLDRLHDTAIACGLSNRARLSALQ